MRAFVGLGPGRCGTESLYRIVGGCANTRVTHEGFNSRWYVLDDTIQKLGREMIASGETLVGDVSCRLFTAVPYLRRHVKGLKLVCLHRPKDEVVASWMRTIKPPFRPSDRSLHYKQNRWAERYPMIDAATPEQSIGFWWEMCETFMQSVAAPVLHLQCAELSDDAKVGELFDFLEIPEADRVLLERRQWNQAAEAAGRGTLDHWARMRKNSPEEWRRLVHG